MQLVERLWQDLGVGRLGQVIDDKQAALDAALADSEVVAVCRKSDGRYVLSIAGARQEVLGPVFKPTDDHVVPRNINQLAIVGNVEIALDLRVHSKQISIHSIEVAVIGAYLGRSVTPD